MCWSCLFWTSIKRQFLNPPASSEKPWLLFIFRLLPAAWLPSYCPALHLFCLCHSSLMPFSASVFPSHAKVLHLLQVLQEGNVFGSSNISEYLDFYFFLDKCSFLTLFHLLHFCSSVHTRPRLRACVRDIPILPQPPCLNPSIPVALLSPQRGGSSNRELWWCPVI